jgi:ATP-dependent helicase HepA
MIGFIVKHGGYGLGKVTAQHDGQITVEFFSPKRKVNLAVNPSHPVVKRRLLPLNTICSSPDGKCRIVQIIPTPTTLEPYRYQVELESGIAKELSEINLTPEESPIASSVLDALCELQLEGYTTFQKRETFAEVWRSSIRQTAGLRALLSSRIDLRPHQAYVVGTVLLDRIPRYILADEVGLGKTIEAGIVIHDLLERKPGAKILVLCPSTLTQQWLCELYAKFSGRVFAMLDFRASAARAGIIPNQAISSYPAALKHAARLQHTRWDMVVVDEAHHLLNASRLYRLVQQLSISAPGFLLLSAIPAQRREDEYLRLLALLEPSRYQPDSIAEKERFCALYARQLDLGRKLSYISRRLGEFSVDPTAADRILARISELIALPVLSQDESLTDAAHNLNPSSPEFAEQVQSLLHHVGDRYRISRRILRNRRSQLLEAEPDLKIARQLRRLPYNADQLEIDAGNAARYFLRTLHERGLPDNVLLPFARCLFQSLSDPHCLCANQLDPIESLRREIHGEPEHMEPPRRTSIGSAIRERVRQTTEDDGQPLRRKRVTQDD